MKTKIKTNLKRAVLFFIPLCLIAGMLAVPAFAAWEWIEWPALSETEIEPETLRINGGELLVNTAGMYAFTTTNVDFEGDSIGVYNVEFPLVPNTDDLDLGYIKLIDDTGGIYYYAINTIAGSASFYISSAGTPFYRFWTFNGIDYIQVPAVNAGEVISITFYFYEFPPDFEPDEDEFAVQEIWEILPRNSTLSKVRSNTPDPEPPAGDDDGGAGDTSGIFAVWTQITDWIINGLKSATNAFYYNGQLTLLGYLCIIPLALGVALLLISIIQKFLRLRG